MTEATNSERICILGGASAIAQAFARRKAKQGAKLLLVDRNEKHLAAVAGDLIVQGAAEVETMAVDLTDEAAQQQVFERATHVFGGLDVLLLAYGTLPKQAECEASSEETLQQLTINFVSAVVLLTHFQTYFAKQGNGTIAVISSVAGDRGRQSNYVYGAAKGGLTVFLSGLRNRLAPTGVHVLTIKPGFVDTPMTKDFTKGFLWVQPETVARDIDQAIRNKRDVIYTPWFWRWIMLVIRLIPERVFKRLSL